MLFVHKKYELQFTYSFPRLGLAPECNSISNTWVYYGTTCLPQDINKQNYTMQSLREQKKLGTIEHENTTLDRKKFAPKRLCMAYPITCYMSSQAQIATCYNRAFQTIKIHYFPPSQSDSTRNHKQLIANPRPNYTGSHA